MSSGSPSRTLAVARLHRTLELTADTPLTLQQYRILGLLSIGGERAGVIARRLAVSKPTVTALVDTLVERGLAERRADADDRRSVTVSITDAGRAAVADTAAALQATLDDVVGRCTDPSAVAAALDQLGPALDAWWADRNAATAAAPEVRA